MFEPGEVVICIDDTEQHLVEKEFRLKQGKTYIVARSLPVSFGNALTTLARKSTAIVWVFGINLYEGWANLRFRRWLREIDGPALQDTLIVRDALKELREPYAPIHS